MKDKQISTYCIFPSYYEGFLLLTSNIPFCVSGLNEHSLLAVTKPHVNACQNNSRLSIIYLVFTIYSNISEKIMHG